MSNKESLNFVEIEVEKDLEAGTYAGRVHTRFPPEPNGYLHIGHAKSICLNFGLAKKYGGKTNLRFDDTNPVTEDTEYVDSIKADIKWLGFEWEGQELYASDYFEQLYEFAVKLIQDGKAYVDDSSAEEIAKMKGTPTQAGLNSPFRERTIEENLRLFEGMKNGEYPDGARVLRAKYDMASPNMLLRDPNLYRIKRAHHHRTGDKWCIYPLYDFAHGQSDAIEKITHSVCTLEFKNHRPLYDWLIESLGIYPTRQIEFARLNLEYTMMSKRKLLQLVNDKHVSGWDDPRMPTISGMRRRGYSAAAIRNFCDRIGIAKRDNVIEYASLEFSVREDLNKVATRVMGVLDPVKLVITNYPKDQVEFVEIENNPEDPESGVRSIPFSGELYIEREDFMEDPPKKFFRLGPERSVRLKSGYIITCTGFDKDPDTDAITEIRCTYYPDSKSGADTSGIKAKGTLHWVSVKEAVPVEIRLYDRLFSDPNPAGHPDQDFREFLNPDSLRYIPTAYVEPALKEAKLGQHFQFIRKGYYCLDQDSSSEKLVFNQTVGLKDSWAKKG
ncbi:MAG: glutamine--tRNA ligase/YqeY domain fusion protein [Saprospiraceae bacterium]|nr:glutamine--tRNA ligase/YqeY domain fusion protein [Saprospiraceae bacterium]